jgi:hypothetical protein
MSPPDPHFGASTGGVMAAASGPRGTAILLLFLSIEVPQLLVHPLVILAQFAQDLICCLVI